MKMWASAGFLIPSKHDQTIDRPNPFLVLITLDFAPRHAPSAIRIKYPDYEAGLSDALYHENPED